MPEKFLHEVLENPTQKKELQSKPGWRAHTEPETHTESMALCSYCYLSYDYDGLFPQFFVLEGNHSKKFVK